MSIFFAVIAPRPFEADDVMPVMLTFPQMCVDMEGSMRFVRGIYNDGASDIHLTWAKLQPTTPTEITDFIVYVNYPFDEIEMNATISEIRTTLSYLSGAQGVRIRPAPDGLAFVLQSVNAERMTAMFVEHARKSIQLVK